MDAYNKAARGDDSHGDAPAPGNRVGDAYGSILAADQALLARRIGRVRQHRALGAKALAAAAGRIIERYPHCPRHASRLVDFIAHAHDLAIWEGRA
jgi:hypothetical protein